MQFRHPFTNNFNLQQWPQQMQPSTEVLTPDPTQLWGQGTSYANPGLFGNISKWKKHLLFHPIAPRETRAPKYALTLWLDEGTLHLFTCKEMEMLLRWSLEWTTPHSRHLTTLILTDILCYQLPLVFNIIQTPFLPDSFILLEPNLGAILIIPLDSLQQQPVCILSFHVIHCVSFWRKWCHYSLEEEHNKCNISAKKVNPLSARAKDFSVCATDAFNAQMFLQLQVLFCSDSSCFLRQIRWEHLCVTPHPPSTHPHTIPLPRGKAS